ncbi:MAG: LCP family protein [Candidatus Wallbacteria bacterium]|nr:LCP family protein [Candidatus Wallbacteria bacterium]
MIDYRVNADRQRRLAFRRFKSYVSRRPGELAASRKTVSTQHAVPGDPWRAVAAFSGENLATFLANKLRYSLLYKLAGLLVVIFCVLVSSFLAVTYARIRGGTTLLRGLIADKVAKKEPQALTFLVLGADDMNGERGRSDAIMLVRLDLEHKKIRCLSVPRDSYVLLRHKGDHMDKLNHAYFYGGPELSRSTLETTTTTRATFTSTWRPARKCSTASRPRATCDSGMTTPATSAA